MGDAAAAPGQCRLLAGPAALSAQLLLAAVALASLVYKRCGVVNTAQHLQLAVLPVITARRHSQPSPPQYLAGMSSVRNAQSTSGRSMSPSRPYPCWRHISVVRSQLQQQICVKFGPLLFSCSLDATSSTN